MDVSSLDLNNIEFKHNNKYIEILCNNSKITFSTNYLRIPFNIIEKDNYYQLQLQLDGARNGTNIDNISIQNFLLNINEIIITYLDISKNRLISPLRKIKNYDDIIVTKINKIKNISQIDIISKSGISTIYDIKKNTYIKCMLEIGNIWKTSNGKYIYKIICNKIEIQ